MNGKIDEDVLLDGCVFVRYGMVTDKDIICGRVTRMSANTARPINSSELGVVRGIFEYAQLGSRDRTTITYAGMELDKSGAEHTAYRIVKRGEAFITQFGGICDSHEDESDLSCGGRIDPRRWVIRPVAKEVLVDWRCTLHVPDNCAYDHAKLMAKSLGYAFFAIKGIQYGLDGKMIGKIRNL